MSLSMPDAFDVAPSFLVGPYALVMAYAGEYFQRTFASDGLTIGTPIAEAEDVPNRRAMAVHPLTPAQIAFGRGVLEMQQQSGIVQILAGPPEDWRYPVSPSPTQPRP